MACRWLKSIYPHPERKRHQSAPMATQQTSNDATTRSATRVRDNQRRARERHKAYVEGLKIKVDEYERRGVQATLEMQQAARRVAGENAKLRTLLKRRGVTDEEVEEFLASDDAATIRVENSNRVKRRRVVSEAQSRGHCLSQSTRPDDSSAHASTPVIGSSSQTSNDFPVSAATNLQQQCCSGQTQCTMCPDEASAARPSSDTTLEVEFLQDGDSGVSPPKSPMTMSCTAAARIVADARGHGDSESIKTSLGCCAEGEECMVKNTILFQVLEAHGMGS